MIKGKGVRKKVQLRPWRAGVWRPNKRKAMEKKDLQNFLS